METLPKSLQNYRNQGFSIADNVKEQYRDPDKVSMGSDDEIYGDAPDNMDDLMDTGGYDLEDQYVSNVFLCNELT